MSVAAPLPAPPSRRARLLLYLPYLTLALFVAAIVALVWFTRNYYEEEQQATLINDVLWMEQNLHFQLDRNEAQLAQIGPELFAVAPGERLPPQTEAQLRQLLHPDRGMARVLWIGSDGAVRGAFPPASDEQAGGGGPAAATANLARLARAVGRPVYGPAYRALGGEVHFEVYVPAYSDSAMLGVVVGVHSLPNLVVRELPWWFSERYRVSVIDADGKELTAKSKVAPLSKKLEYTMAFDPPGHGMNLRITAYKAELRWIPVLLIGSITLLATIIVWSIWQLRRQLARRLAAEQALRGESAFRKAMEDSLLTGLRARDLDGRLIYVNPAFCRMVGFSAEELVGQTPPMPYWDPEHLEHTQELHDHIMAGGTPHEGFEVRLRRRNGERLDALVFEAPLIDARGRRTGWMGSVLDITEQKRARALARQQEERLQATSRLVTMGEMASTLAHELNQPLAAIASYNSGCLNQLEKDVVDRAELKDIHLRLARQARRAGEIIRRVHDFVRRSEPKRELLDLNVIIRDAVGLIEADAKKRRVGIDCELAARLPEVAVDPVMIEQVIVNLVRNGMDAMKETPAPKRMVRVTTAEEGGHVVVRVTDHGRGVPPETAARLFEPFFTTKAEGMGMGLNICRSIAELHRGRLGFAPNPAGGTIFTLSLPVEPL